MEHFFSISFEVYAQDLLVYWTHFSYRHGLSRRIQYVYTHSLTERCSELDFGISLESENILSQLTCNWMTDKNVYFSSTLGGDMHSFRGFIGPPFGWSLTLHKNNKSGGWLGFWKTGRWIIVQFVMGTCWLSTCDQWVCLYLLHFAFC